MLVVPVDSTCAAADRVSCLTCVVRGHEDGWGRGDRWIYDGFKGVTRQADGGGGWDKENLPVRPGRRWSCLAHASWGQGRKQSLCGGGHLLDGEGGKFGRGGINRRLCLVYMVDGRWWTVDRLSRASNEPVARGRAFAWTENRGGGKQAQTINASRARGEVRQVRLVWSGKDGERSKARQEAADDFRRELDEQETTRRLRSKLAMRVCCWVVLAAARACRVVSVGSSRVGLGPDTRLFDATSALLTQRGDGGLGRGA